MNTPNIEFMSLPEHLRPLTDRPMNPIDALALFDLDDSEIVEETRNALRAPFLPNIPEQEDKK